MGDERGDPDARLPAIGIGSLRFEQRGIRVDLECAVYHPTRVAVLAGKAQKSVSL